MFVPELSKGMNKHNYEVFKEICGPQPVPASSRNDAIKKVLENWAINNESKVLEVRVQ